MANPESTWRAPVEPTSMPKAALHLAPLAYTPPNPLSCDTGYQGTPAAAAAAPAAIKTERQQVHTHPMQHLPSAQLQSQAVGHTCLTTAPPVAAQPAADACPVHAGCAGMTSAQAPVTDLQVQIQTSMEQPAAASPPAQVTADQQSKQDTATAAAGDPSSSTPAGLTPPPVAGPLPAEVAGAAAAVPACPLAAVPNSTPGTIAAAAAAAAVADLAPDASTAAAAALQISTLLHQGLVTPGTLDAGSRQGSTNAAAASAAVASAATGTGTDGTEMPTEGGETEAGDGDTNDDDEYEEGEGGDLQGSQDGGSGEEGAAAAAAAASAAAVAVTYGGHGSHICLVSENVLMDMRFSIACCVSHAARFEVNNGLLMHCLCMHDLAASPPPPNQP